MKEPAANNAGEALSSELPNADADTGDSQSQNSESLLNTVPEEPTIGPNVPEDPITDKMELWDQSANSTDTISDLTKQPANSTDNSDLTEKAANSTVIISDLTKQPANSTNTNSDLTEKPANSTATIIAIMEPCDKPENSTDSNKTKANNSSMNENNAPGSTVDLPMIACRSDASLLKQVLLKNAFIAPNADPTQAEEKLQIFVPDKGPKWYNVNGPIVTERCITKNLPIAFNYLPVHGRPDKDESLEQFQDRKIREFIGCDLNDDEYGKLSEICSTDHLRTGKELQMISNAPMLNYHTADMEVQAAYSAQHEGTNLCVVQKHKLRMERDEALTFSKKLKYRGLRLMPLAQQKLEAPPSDPNQEQLDPGLDILFHIRIYRPFFYNMNQKVLTGALAPCRHSLLSRDLVVSGRSSLRALSQRLVCANDGDSRHDVSNTPNDPPAASAKELFPSSFMFINNVFYVEDRPGCKDLSEPIREWCLGRGLGPFPREHMEWTLMDIPLRLGHPEVYVHQGNCEHLFTISEIRLVNLSDPLDVSHYPCHTTLSQNQSVYCTTCAEFCAKWIVVGSKRVPFDPAFFCDNCLKMYLYEDGKKIEDFKLYAYRGNEMNILKASS